MGSSKCLMLFYFTFSLFGSIFGNDFIIQSCTHQFQISPALNQQNNSAMDDNEKILRVLIRRQEPEFKCVTFMQIIKIPTQKKVLSPWQEEEEEGKKI